MNYPHTARQIITLLGGEANILSLYHCITRLRFSLVSLEKVDRAALEHLDGVMGVNLSGDQFQVIIGSEVAPLCQAILAQLPGLEAKKQPRRQSDATRFPWCWRG